MWQQIELQEIRIFLVLAEELHFGRTAERVGLTQSRVSQSVRALERKLGVDLAQRTSRRVTLTATGKRFHTEAGAALVALERVLVATEATGERITDPLHLGIVSAAMVGPSIQSIIDAYQKAHPDSTVEIVGLPFRDRFGPLRRGEIDAMIVSLPVDEPDLMTSQALATQRRMLAVARHHPLAARAEVSIEELADHVIGDLELVAPRALLEAMAPRLTPAGRPIPRVRVRAEEPSTLMMAIASGRIVQPVTEAFAATYSHPQVTYRPITDLAPTPVALAWRRHNRHRPLRALLHIAQRPGRVVQTEPISTT
jgi:DNA-binding transcriptional LysR family regulator